MAPTSPATSDHPPRLDTHRRSSSGPIHEYAIASFIAGDVTTYPLFLYGQVRIRIGLPQMIAVSVIVLVLSMLLVTGTEIWRRRAGPRLTV